MVSGDTNVPRNYIQSYYQTIWYSLDSSRLFKRITSYVQLFNNSGPHLEVGS
jgi:predicted solute-binding protein